MERLADFELIKPEVAKEPTEYYNKLRSGCPVSHTDTFGGFWLMSRYQDVYEALLDPVTYSSSLNGISIPKIPQPPVICLEQDEPEHRKFRKPMQAWFTVARMRKFEPQVREIVTNCLDQFAAEGRGDLALSLAQPVPPLVVARLLGLPEADWPWFRERDVTALRLTREGDNTGAAAAIADLHEYVRERLNERRKQPTDDLLSEIAALEIDGMPITDDDAVAMALLTLNAAHDTTVAGIGGLLYHLARNQNVQDQVTADQSLVESAVDEALRIATPILGQGRTATEDLSLEGVEVPKGDQVMLLLGSANRDPSRFPSPDEFRLDRPRNQHVSFGAGIHRCVGAPLAKLEMQVVLEEVLRRLPNLRIDDEDAVSVEYNVAVCTFTSLPAAWDLAPGGSA
ncbi:cytochrome P450 [Nocardioides sp. LS1]|uniref:cytochrome P450 n=1 Tax=Nocardioides sp. LS1 TaxID=1027620 RepID=UPI000F6214D3|nr:cytochrome P450 [Nocardioides sp. LS1]GCD91133.1 cytochrome P450 [Nocardioides sp. LS1]